MIRIREDEQCDGRRRTEAEEIEGGKGGLRPLEERFRLRSSSYAPTSRFRLEAGKRWKGKRWKVGSWEGRPTADGGALRFRLEAGKRWKGGRQWNSEVGMRNAE
jgi:hypothetical protein